MSSLTNKGMIKIIMLFAMSSQAADLTLKEYHMDPVQHINVAQPTILKRLPATTALPGAVINGKISVNVNELKYHPDLVKKALLSALVANNEKGVSLLLPIFKQQDPGNILYLTWGNAIIAHANESYHQAITLYRKVLAEQPQALAAHLQLAMTLYENYDNNSAIHEFTTLRQQQGISGDVEYFIDRYLQALRERNAWKFSGSINYLDDHNVNNAPKRGTQLGYWTTAGPESAKGMGYYAATKKKKQLASNVYSATEIYGFGKYYINNHKYDEATIRAASGVNYQNAKTEITLLPFFEQSWYAGGYSSTNKTMKRYNHNYGVRTEINQIINNNWLFSGVIEYGMRNYTKRHYLTGDNVLFSTVIIYTPNARRYLFTGSDYYQENTREKDNAYRRKSIRIGWGENWGPGINTSLVGSYASRNYFARDFFGIKKNNNEYSLMVSVWHAGVNFLGFTPVVVWQYSKNASNHPFYRYEKNRIYFEIERKLH